MATAEAVASRQQAVARPTPAGGNSDERLARALGWFSIGLGLTGLAAPNRLASTIGAPKRPGLTAAFGLREIATGIAILAKPRAPGRLWTRVGGDLADLATLGAAYAAGGSAARLAAATAAVAGVTLLDIHASRRLGRLAQGDRVDRFEASVAIGRPRDEVYRFWRDLRNLPRFMPQLVSVEEQGERTSRWVARAPGGKTIEWTAETTEDRPGDLIAWRTLPGATVAHAGAVRFVDAPGNRGTAVRLEMGFDPPGGPLGALAASIFGQVPRQQMQNDLRRLKQLLETGEIPTTDGQSSGRRSDQARRATR